MSYTMQTFGSAELNTVSLGMKCMCGLLDYFLLQVRRASEWLRLANDVCKRNEGIFQAKKSIQDLDQCVGYMLYTFIKPC